MSPRITSFMKRVDIPFARFAIFVIFFWFGILKVLGLSPASDLVQALFEQTISFISFPTFFVLLGLAECLIGILFLIRGFERTAFMLLMLHMITTFMPLFCLPDVTWSGFLTPTLEGQYIIKNLLIISVAIGILANSRQS